MTQSIKIISWNVNGLRTRIIDDKDAKQFSIKTEISSESQLAKLLEQFEADIICFQETRCAKETTKSFQIEEYNGYYSSSSSEKKGRIGNRYSGVGIWVKKHLTPCEVSQELPTLPNKDIEGRILTLYFENFIVINTYQPNAGSNFDYRITQWDPAMRNYLEYLQDNYDIPIIWTGDLNVAHQDYDAFFTQPSYHFRHHKKVKDLEWLTQQKVVIKDKQMPGFTREERENFSEILDLGFIDAWRHLNPNNKYDGYTWWNMRIPYHRKIDRGWRIDYFLVNAIYQNNIISCQVYPRIGEGDKLSSDHAPICLEIEIPN